MNGWLLVALCNAPFRFWGTKTSSSSSSSSATPLPLCPSSSSLTSPPESSSSPSLPNPMLLCRELAWGLGGAWALRLKLRVLISRFFFMGSHSLSSRFPSTFRWWKNFRRCHSTFTLQNGAREDRNSRNPSLRFWLSHFSRFCKSANIFTNGCNTIYSAFDSFLTCSWNCWPLDFMDFIVLLNNFQLRPFSDNTIYIAFYPFLTCSWNCQPLGFMDFIVLLDNFQLHPSSDISCYWSILSNFWIFFSNFVTLSSLFVTSDLPFTCFYLLWWY